MFKTIYFIGFITLLIIRIYYRVRNRDVKIVESYVSTLERILFFLDAVGVIVIPLLYIFTSWLEFAEYQLPSWLGWIGALILAFAILLLWRSHADLGRNWSQSLELRKGHELIDHGVYKYIRHPMYAAIWLYCIAQILLLHNVIAGWSALVSFGLLYFLRVPREENMMLDQFGEEYQAYMRKTGRVIPPINLLLGA